MWDRKEIPSSGDGDVGAGEGEEGQTRAGEPGGGWWARVAGGGTMMDRWKLTSFGLAIALIASWIWAGFFLEFKAPTFFSNISGRMKMEEASRDGTLIMLPRRDGFNSQMASVYEDLACVLQSNPLVVVPHMLENMASGDGPSHGPFPFEDYYDMPFLRQQIRAVKPADYFDQCRRILVNCHEDQNTFRSRRIVINDHREPSVLVLDYYRETFGVEFHCAEDLVYADYNLEGSQFDCVANLTLKFQCETALPPQNQRGNV